MVSMTTATDQITPQSPGAGGPATRTTGLRRRIFARLWTVMDGPVDDQVAVAKADVLAELEGPIVEIGAGLGSSFHRYPAGTRVIAFEPNRFMGDGLTAAALAAGIELDLHTRDLREVGLPSESVQTVVSVLTLCSVADRVGLLAEIHRILRPGGRFVFIEHVAERDDRRRLLLQRLVRPGWRALFDGCDPLAPTDRLIADAGFSHLRATTRNLGPALDPTNLTHWGVATK